jgi:hypothetical protein
MKQLTNITDENIVSRGVQSLADRPNRPSQYGEGGLSSVELKKVFDRLASFLAKKINEIQNVMKSREAAEYICINLGEELGLDEASLNDLISAINSGKLATILQLKPSASTSRLKSLQTIVNNIDLSISENKREIPKSVEFISENGKTRLVFRNYLGAIILDVEDVRFNIVQTTGNSETAVMSQKATTYAIDIARQDTNRYTDEEITNLRGELIGYTDSVTDYVYDSLQVPISNHETRLENLERHINQDYFVTDNAVEYSKPVPLNACPYAEISKIGGMTYKEVYGITNIYDGIGIIEANGERTNEVIFEREINAPVTINAATNFSSYHPDGAGSGGVIFTAILADGSYYALEPYELPATLPSLSKLIWVNDGRAYGTVSSIEIWTELYAYKPSKVTKIVSHDNNLFNGACPESIPSNTTVESVARKFEPNTCIVGITRTNFYMPESGTSSGKIKVVKIHSRTENAFSITCRVTGYGFAYYFELKPNTKYTLTYETEDAGKVRVAYTFYDDEGNYLKNGYSDTKELKFTTNEYGNTLIHFVTINAGDTITVSNIMLNYGDALPYRPYNPNPIDTFVIPSEITTLEGYGESNPDNADEYNYIDFRYKRFVAHGHLMGGEIWGSYGFPVVTDLSKYITLDKFIEVVGRGHLEFVNEHNQAVPSEIHYLLKEV